MDVMLTREQIREKQDRALEEVEVPAWGGSLFFGALTLRERNKLMAKWSALQDMDQSLEGATEVHLDVLIASCCDVDGEPLFTEEDREWLGDKDAEVLEGLATKALAFLGLSQEGHEDAVGNSERTPTEPIKSDSPAS